MFDLLLLVLLLRSPTWLLLTIGVVVAAMWIGAIVGWRIILAIPGFVLLLVGLMVANSGVYPAAWWLIGTGCALAGPFILDPDRREQARREQAAKRLADANRIRPVKTSSWIDAAMVVSGALLAFAAMITGEVLDERFHPWPTLNLFAFAGFILGAVALIGAIIWAGERERKRKQTIPRGLIGRSSDGLYVYDADVLKDQSRQRPR